MALIQLTAAQSAAEQREGINSNFLYVEGLVSPPVGGWIPLSNAFGYASADAPTFTMTVLGDLTGLIYPGVRVKLTQTTVKYFICTASAYSDPTTTITLYGGTDYTLANAAISSVYYSTVKAPVGFPLDPAKWNVVLVDSTIRTITTNITSWHNIGGLYLDIPIGTWKLKYRAYCRAFVPVPSSSTYAGLIIAISTISNNISDSAYESLSRINATNISDYYASVSSDVNIITLAAKTRHYVVTLCESADVTEYALQNEFSHFYLIAECAYL